MGKEIFNQSRPWPEQGADPNLMPVDLEELRESFFDKFTKNFCRRRTIVDNPDHSRAIIETYHIPIENLLKVDNKDIVEFLHIATILGYRSAIGPVFLPDMDWPGKPIVGIKPAVVFVLERTESSS